jgi:hypothetical protein
MATAIEVLKAAAAQIQLSSPLGRWAQKVSALLDSGVAVPDYGMAKLVTPQAIVGTTNLILDAQGLTRGISYTPATGTWLLDAGKTYLLRGHGYADTFSAVNASLKIQWVDDNNVPLTSGGPDCPPAQLYPMTGTGANSTEPTTEIIYRPPNTVVGRSVKLRVTALVGTANIPASGFTAVIQEIPG